MDSFFDYIQYLLHKIDESFLFLIWYVCIIWVALYIGPVCAAASIAATWNLLTEHFAAKIDKLSNPTSEFSQDNGSGSSGSSLNDTYGLEEESKQRLINLNNNERLFPVYQQGDVLKLYVKYIQVFKYSC